MDESADRGRGGENLPPEILNRYGCALLVLPSELTRYALLYTEMVTADAVIRGDREAHRLLSVDVLGEALALVTAMAASECEAAV